MWGSPRMWYDPAQLISQQLLTNSGINKQPAIWRTTTGGRGDEGGMGEVGGSGVDGVE
jgi:hypothetical protein